MQFRAISFGLYGSQDYHMSVRQKAVAYIREHKQEYANFLGEDIDAYLADMQEHATWGDELTLVSTTQFLPWSAQVILCNPEQSVSRTSKRLHPGVCKKADHGNIVC